MRKIVPLFVVAGLTVGALATFSQANTREETIKKVMKEAMKGGLCKSVASGTASAADKAKLLDLFKDLAGATPPKGEDSSWKSKSKALVDAAQAVVDGKDGATAQLQKAANCKACHEAHK